MKTILTTMRFSETEVALMDAAVKYKRHTSGGSFSRSQVVRRALRGLKPPGDELGPLAVEWRKAYAAMMDEHNDT